MWPGTMPELTTKVNGYAKVFAPYLVFLIVGLVDVLIVYYSLNNIPGFNNWEPIFFAAPVIGVQLVFPHLIGQRLALLSHGTREKLRNQIEGLVLFAVWITFAIALTQIRMLYIEKLAFEDNEPLNDVLFAILWLTNFLMLVGLGSWLLLLESRRNHHEHAALRIMIRIEKLRDQRNAALENLERANSVIPSLELAESVARSSYEDAVNRAGSSLAEAARRNAFDDSEPSPLENHYKTWIFIILNPCGPKIITTTLFQVAPPGRTADLKPVTRLT
jgi:hypothetical protein